MESTNKCLCIITCVVMFLAIILMSTASAHALFKPGSLTTPPRSDNLFNNLKVSPCGGLAKSTNSKVYKAGEEIKVEWVETIDHPGFYRISFSKSGDSNFKAFGNDMPDMNNGRLLQGQVYENSTMITLPSIACTDCSLQLIQVMTENPANPTNYYSCSDIQLVVDPNDITPPSNIVLPMASSSNNQIQLQWSNPLSDFNSVLVLQSTSAFTDTFDAPLSNVSYNAGDTIGSSKVIYVGENDSYIDNQLDQGTVYYYKFFTFDLNRNYANGVSINATTSVVQGVIDNGATTPSAPETTSPVPVVNSPSNGGAGSLGILFLISLLIQWNHKRGRNDQVS